MMLSPLGKYLLYQLYQARLLMPKIGPDEAETLHQFRICLRRVRSLIRLYPHDSLPFPESLKSLFKSTNVLRELDVLILSLKNRRYENIRSKLDAVRREEYRLLFESEEWKKGAEHLDAFYDTLTEVNPSWEATHLISTAKEHFSTSIDLYRSLSETATQKELHALRIRFKISRYGLEFLLESSLENEKEKIAECKRYQNRFGEIQDLHNQVRWLKKLYARFPFPELEQLRKERKKKLKKLKATSRSA